MTVWIPAALTTAALIPLPAVGQTAALDRGSVQIAGQASVNVTDDGSDDDSVTTYQLLPSLMFFLSPGLAVGGQLQLQRSAAGDASSTTYGIGPAIAYYFVQEGNAHPFLRGSVRVGRTSFDAGDVEIDGSIFGFRAGGGLLFLITESVGIDAEVYFDRVQLGGDLDGDANNYGLAVGISAFVF